MPIATVINGVHHAVHADHLNTPRRLSDSAGQTRWQWPYSGFGEINPQSTPAAGQAAVSYSLRYPGQVDDGNGLFYNWNRFYDPRVGRYTSSDPIGLEGGWNRFGYVGGNPLSLTDPEGLRENYNLPGRHPNPQKCATAECAYGLLPLKPPRKMSPGACFTACFAAKTGIGLTGGALTAKAAMSIGPRVGAAANNLLNSEIALLGSELMAVEFCYKQCDFKGQEICEIDQLSNIIAP